MRGSGWRKSLPPPPMLYVLNGPFLNNKGQINSCLKLHIFKEWSLAMSEQKIQPRSPKCNWWYKVNYAGVGWLSLLRRPAGGRDIQLNRPVLNIKRQGNSCLKLQIFKEWSLTMSEKKIQPRSRKCNWSSFLGVFRGSPPLNARNATLKTWILFNHLSYSRG